MIAAPGSNQGKTTITAGLARYHRNAGRRVRVFKIGPDFLDPMILERASGNPVEQLDLWMVGEEECRRLLADAAQDADLLLLEGVMGLFDGSPSSADLARTFGVPIMLVVDASGMAQSFGALVHGFTSYQPELPFAGVLANRVGSDGHGNMLSGVLPDDVPYLGHFLRDDQAALPDRHLGLIQASEIDDLDARIEKAAGQISRTGLVDLPKEVAFSAPPASPPPNLLSGKTIACARDEAFSFIYPANIRCLQDMGATVVTFSPLTDTGLPKSDAIYLPGGYPELHLETLSKNTSMQAALRTAFDNDVPILAECGGLLYLLETLQDFPMAGLLPGSARMQEKLSAIGLQSVQTSEGSLRGHTFHYSRLETSLDVTTRATSQRTKRQGEAIYGSNNLVASYVHFYFPSCPEATAKLFMRSSKKELFA
ncbi:MAG: cobyrinate a,c-diamide synthase [Rhodospirillales bacterium]|nr:cobyrinate a,c-diamide synthase [Rhodospirillales bacterium]